MDAMQSDLWTMAPAIAEAMGDEWALRAPKSDNEVWPHFVTTADPDRVVFLTCWGYNGGKVEVHGVYPRDPRNREHLPYDVKRPEIGVTLKRGPEVIAREIKRRFLPAYDELLAVSTNMRDKANDYHTGVVDTVHVLEVGLGRKLGLVPADNDRFAWRWYYGDGSYGDVTITNGRVDIDAKGLTPEEAIKVLDVVLHEGSK